ncbi:hypothetical protein QPK87_09115 [Kamptonema cortianum]|nr:hypothetical protein [Kamptonema cortianum]MDL5046192.1 hypothetical protein [Oscillatoria amoena NRMC-F 0135]
MPIDTIATLKAGQSEAEISPELGCQTLSWKCGGQDIIYLDPEYREKWPTLNLWGNPILFPAPGLCSIGNEGNVWSFENKKYRIDFHGFGDKLPWQTEYQDDSSIVCSLTHSGHTLRQYPFEFVARQKITLSETALTIDFEVTNQSIMPMPYGVGWHPYFKKPRKADGSKGEWLVKMPDGQRWTGSGKLDPWKESVISSADRFGIGNVLLYKNDLPVTLCTDASDGPRIEIIPESFGTVDRAMAWVIWNISADCDYLCVEPWTAPPNVLNEPSSQIVVEPGQTCRQRLTYRKTA